MFYSVGAVSRDNYPCYYQLGNFVISTDTGWHRRDNYLYKGYADGISVEDTLDTPTTGNYTVLRYNDDSTLSVITNIGRSYRLYWQDGVLTNLEQLSYNIWADKIVTINPDFTVREQQIPGTDITTDHLSIDQARAEIKQILDAAVDNYYTNNKSINLFCTGGVDTMLLYAMLPRDKTNLVRGQHYEQNSFTSQNQSLLNNYWAYKQIHHWLAPTVLATGSHGDEYMLRGPATIAMLTAWHDVNFGKLLAHSQDTYHYKYFNRYQNLWSSSWEERHKLREQYPTKQLLNAQIINMLLNDHQHWHLGNTITWTPFKDIRIAELLLRCSIDDLLPQFVDAALTKDLIRDFDSQALKYLSTYKNHNSLENMDLLYKNNSL